MPVSLPPNSSHIVCGTARWLSAGSQRNVHDFGRPQIGAGSFSNVANGDRTFLNLSAGSFIVTYGAGSPFDPSHVVLSNCLRSAGADFDDDRDIDNDDLRVRQGAYGTTDLGDGDADSDGADFRMWQQRLGSVPAATPVPEPATAMPVIAAAIGFRGIGSRMRQELVSA
jgi:hypothetical protein